MKAFLSHSSKDKEFVRAVAKELGRQFCAFDEQVFQTGEEFKKSIEKGFDESSVFVLFASLNSLDSIWVTFEMDEAWFRKLRNTLKKSLVYIIDSSLDSDRLPDWLRRALIRREIAPKLVARDIRHHLNDLLLEKHNMHFIGRSDMVDEIERALTTPIDGSKLPRAVYITGLPGIGRRSLIKKTAPSILSLRKFVEVRIGESDTIIDLCITVADFVEPYTSIEGFKQIVKSIRSLDDENALQRTMLNLRKLVQAGELPILFDDGGLIDDEGYIREPIRLIIQSLSPNDEAYIFFVSTRKPRLTSEFQIPVIQVKNLSLDSTKRLLSLLAQDANIKISNDGIADIAEYVAGYPPSAYFAIQQAKNYGVDFVLRDKTSLIEFNKEIFLKHLEKQGLKAHERNLLYILAAYSPLPLSVLVNFFSIEPDLMSKTLINLIDLSLIVTTNEGYYRIADPIANAAVTAYGYPTVDDSKKIAHLISKFIGGLETDLRLLDLSRVMYRAARWAKDDKIAANAIHFSNDLIKITENHYHARKYVEAIKFGREAIKERPESITARDYLIRALIQEEQYSDAESEIEKIKEYAHPRLGYYLTGFLERKRRNFKEAIKAYSQAKTLGREDSAIKRELASCYSKLGDQGIALKYIEEALEKDHDNPYLLNLWAEVATKLRDETTVNKALARLNAINDELFYYHRMSRAELTLRGDWRAAHEAAKKAIQCAQAPHFEVISQLANCDIGLGYLKEAEDLIDRLDREFKNVRRNVRIALRCRLEIAKGHFSNAIALSEEMKDKNTIFYKRIRWEALRGELRTSALKDSVRIAYQQEVSQLEKELGTLTVEQLIPPE